MRNHMSEQPPRESSQQRAGEFIESSKDQEVPAASGYKQHLM